MIFFYSWHDPLRHVASPPQTQSSVCHIRHSPTNLALKIHKSDLNPYISLSISLKPQPLSQPISVTWSHHHHQHSLKIFNHFEILNQMEASSWTSSSLRRRAPLRCYCAEKPVLVVSWTADNPDRSFYGCPNYWVFQFEYFVLLGFSFFV